MKTPTDILREEHELILRALGTVEHAAKRLEQNGTLPDGWWTEVIEWLRAFADRNHHAKEENLLFPALLRAGIPSPGGPVDVMLVEHTQGRAFIKAMETGGTPEAQASAARSYVALLRVHIDKENGVLFTMADSILDENAQRKLARDFDAVADELGRWASISEAESLLERLVASLP